MPPGEPVDQERLRRLIRGTSVDQAVEVISFFERHDAIRRLGGAARPGEPPGASSARWVRGPEPLWSRVAAALEWSRGRAGDRLAAMREYAESPGCRRQAIARYFKDVTPSCGGCDRCDGTGTGAFD